MQTFTLRNPITGKTTTLVRESNVITVDGVTEVLHCVEKSWKRSSSVLVKAVSTGYTEIVESSPLLITSLLSKVEAGKATRIKAALKI